MLLSLFFALLIILFFVFYIFPLRINHEQFRSNCDDCNNKTIGKCLNCSNCGFIYKGSYGMCTDGDMYGPYNNIKKFFFPKNMNWLYGL